jgi:hypothetical protein
MGIDLKALISALSSEDLFEVKNQAAVSMACAHKILRCLDRMANRGTTMDTQSRVLFSITTQGPIHELWAHWTVVIKKTGNSNREHYRDCGKE